MTVTSITNNVSYIADGVTLVFVYPFRIVTSPSLRVYVDDVLQDVGAYTVAGVNEPGGGSVTFLVAPLLDAVVFLVRLTSPTQEVDYRPFDPFPAETHEQALDKLTLLVQDLSSVSIRAVRAAVVEAVGPNLVLPPPAERAGKDLGFDSSGAVLVTPHGQGIDHGALDGLGDDDHAQYHTNARGDARYLQLAGGTLTGFLTLPTNPTAGLHAATKQYVDVFVGGAIITNYLSDATGDAQGTVEAAWNAQATALVITRAPNELIDYRWPSTLGTAYRYGGNAVGPVWATVAADWPQAVGITDAPSDGNAYVRKNGLWVFGAERNGDQDLSINKSTPLFTLNKSASGAINQVQGKTANALRWVLALGDTTLESGANAGSDFALYSYDDAGNFLGAPVSVERATGVMTLRAPVLNVAGRIVGTTNAGGIEHTDGLGNYSAIKGTPTGPVWGGIGYAKFLQIQESDGRLTANIPTGAQANNCVGARFVSTTDPITAGQTPVDGDIWYQYA
jgi:hypothetical protein